MDMRNSVWWSEGCELGLRIAIMGMRNGFENHLCLLETHNLVCLPESVDVFILFIFFFYLLCRFGSST
jgi:hypothetical protein